MVGKIIGWFTRGFYSYNDETCGSQTTTFIVGIFISVCPNGKVIPQKWQSGPFKEGMTYEGRKENRRGIENMEEWKENTFSL